MPAWLRARWLDAVTALLAVGGLTLLVIGAAPAEDPPYLGTPSPAASPGPLPDPANAPPPPPAATGPVGLGASVPVHLEIPAIRVSTALSQLGLEPDGTIEVPPLRGDAPAGWYRNLSSPGEIGPAVILGHVDTARDGPAVFYQLRDLRPGDPVSVRRADGRTAVFTVDRVAEYAKETFPTAEVYGPVPYPALRLITCGGTFDRLRRQYSGNIVVYATLRT